MITTLPHKQSSLTNREKALAGLVVAISVVTIVNLNLSIKPVSASVVTTKQEDELVSLTNQERKSNGLSDLSFNPALYSAAEAKAEDMLKFGYFDHVSPQGKTPWQFIDAANYRYTEAGENLAIDFKADDAVVKAWMNSPAHRANIVKPDYKEIGIAAVTGSFNGRITTVIVQLFGTKQFSLFSR